MEDKIFCDLNHNVSWKDCCDDNGLGFSKFNQPVDNLPNSIVNLTFGEHFNQPVDNLPNSIVNLTFGEHFNQSVDNLPNSIVNLTFGKNFDKKIDNIPIGLQKIKCCKDYIYKKHYKNIQIEIY